MLWVGLPLMLWADPDPLATEFIQAGDWTAAQRECQRLLAADAADADARFLLAWALHQQHLQAGKVKTLWQPPSTDGVSTAAQALVQACREYPQPNSPGTRIPWNKWIISFYRTQMRPAIGARCELDPSCSEYFLQAGHLHGWRAFPMIADRLVREPQVIADATIRIEVDQHMKVPDPVSQHDQWFAPSGQDGKE